MTCMIGFSGRYSFVWNYTDLSIIWFFPSFLFTTVVTGSFKRHDLILECMCFTIISTFNLILLATGTTGQDGRKTGRLYRLVRLVVSCPSFLALKYKKLSYFVILFDFLGNHYN